VKYQVLNHDHTITQAGIPLLGNTDQFIQTKRRTQVKTTVNVFR